MSTVSTLLLLTLLFGPSSLPQGIRSANSQATNVNHNDEIPTVAFCEMVAHPQLYFDKTIRLAATFEPRIEGSTLTDVRCVRSHDDQIGVGWVKLDEQQFKTRSDDSEVIRSGKAGEQPRVTITGILRNAARKDFEWYRYRFD